MYMISACLAGLNTTYLGKNKLHSMFQWIIEARQGVVFCPEQLGGLKTPRPPAEIINGDGNTALKNAAKILNSLGEDITENFLAGAFETLKLAQLIKPDLIILKERSPSCGVNQIYDGTFSGNIISGTGITTALLQHYGFKTISDEDFIAMKNSQEK